ncbi:hypothetical protein HNY73_016074 [Argiope bruennichi]|uniref:Uncharacterized protein n=1 Tax=Argiope bruennichi TaxID=94029 RepID=A0A8T0EMH0_ARGBR|nr:hypothetical protein HNY73_016074 [Argiope bruennichi]
MVLADEVSPVIPVNRLKATVELDLSSSQSVLLADDIKGARKYLSTDEALALFSELPSDSESVISYGSISDEDYVQPPNLSSSDEEILEIEDTDDTILSSECRPDPSQPIEVTWVPKGNSKTVLPDQKVMVNNGSAEFKTIKDFRREIVRSLMVMGAKPTLEMKRPSTSEVRAIKKHKPYIPEEVKYKNVNHLPVKCKRRRCAYCSTRAKPHQSSTMSETCNVGLCMQPKDNSCFVKFHKK